MDPVIFTGKMPDRAPEARQSRLVRPSCARGQDQAGVAGGTSGLPSTVGPAESARALVPLLLSVWASRRLLASTVLLAGCGRRRPPRRATRSAGSRLRPRADVATPTSPTRRRRRSSRSAPTATTRSTRHSTGAPSGSSSSSTHRTSRKASAARPVTRSSRTSRARSCTCPSRPASSATARCTASRACWRPTACNTCHTTDIATLTPDHEESTWLFVKGDELAGHARKATRAALYCKMCHERASARTVTRWRCRIRPIGSEPMAHAPRRTRGLHHVPPERRAGHAGHAWDLAAARATAAANSAAGDRWRATASRVVATPRRLQRRPSTSATTATTRTFRSWPTGRPSTSRSPRRVEPNRASRATSRPFCSECHVTVGKGQGSLGG